MPHICRNKIKNIYIERNHPLAQHPVADLYTQQGLSKTK
jgi:hypothetical protein